MSTEKATAIVLRFVEWSETSAIVTLFTREFGKIRAVAKGARRSKGPFESALDLLAVCRVVFVRKSSDALDLLTEARLEQRFRPAGRDLSRLYAGYYIAELLGELTDDYDPHPELFDIAGQALAGLKTVAPPAPLVLRFELRALGILGHLPSLSRCSECGRDVLPADNSPARNVASTTEPATGRVAFGQLSGGVLCGRCRPGKKQVVSVRAEVIEMLSRFAAEDDQSWRDIEPRRGIWGEARGLLNQYMSHLLGRRPRMHEYLGMLVE
jgi:DNA repair protein RecO (recombination protein O)